VSPLDQAVACRWIEDGTAARRLAWQREEVGQRWRLAQRVLGRLSGEPSPHAWVSGNVPGAELMRRCRERGIEVVPAEVFAVKQGDLPAIRVSLSAARSRAALKQALALIQTLRTVP
jgi:DNA-binding transcriptional MocR family regulator